MSKDKEILVRIYVVYFLMMLFGIGIVAKLLHVQFANGNDLRSEADQLIYDMRIIEAPKGNIYAADEQKLALAISVPRYNVAIDPYCIRQSLWDQGIDSLSKCLSTLFENKTPAEWKAKLSQKRIDSVQYVLIKNKVNYSNLQKLKQFPILRKGKFKGGLIVVPVSERVLPYKQLAKRTIGYVRVNANDSNYVGLEGAYRDDLQGRDGQMLMKKIAGNQWKPVQDEFSVDPINGHDIYTTIDINIQDVAESALKKQLELQQAARGCAILMEVETGHIKAIANLERAGDSSYYEMFNMSVGRRSEPGSTFKLASLMVALDDGKVRVTDSVNANGKYVYFPGTEYESVLRDSKYDGYGKITLKRAFEVSSNVISRVIHDSYSANPQEFIDGLKRMGLQDRLGVEISGERSPLIKNANQKDFSGITLPWMAIGYELEQTPLQTLTFYNAVANNGVMVKPQFVREIREGDRLIRRIDKHVLNKQICKPATLASVQAMLKGVVQNGTAQKIKPRGFDIAGKTGTVQLIDDNGAYSDKHQASFCGYFPADKPKYSCIVLIQGPTRDIYGSVVSGTVFKEIADKVYANTIEINQKSKSHVVEDLRAPRSKYGSKSELVKVLKDLDVDVKNDANESDYVVTRSESDGLKIENRKVKKGLVPNVVGMGLVDALNLLEGSGLYVRIKGSGTVSAQSQKGGAKLVKGTTITIQLI
ncbi:MAG: transpeptidase family protein [Crocinitomicaceae bacterium]|nr:transpeptidase family protein [Crocinitomicaceae bacterium]MBT6515238.1 transpeptidase family protein [Crocinitomicaceae bacterium]